VYRVLDVLCTLVCPLPIGTNQGLLDLLWMVLRGELLAARGGIFPGLAQLGLPAARVRRAWAALGAGTWASQDLIAAVADVIEREGRWQPDEIGGYRPVAVDVTGFWRPRLKHCPTRHYHAAAGTALPAIPIGLIGRVGRVGDQRVAVLRQVVRADPALPSPLAHNRELARAAATGLDERDVAVCDSGFQVSLLQEAGLTRYLVRLPKNFTGRRRQPPPRRGRGKHPRKGPLVRPLPRAWKGRLLPATPPDRVITWSAGAVVLRGEQWLDLVVQAGDCDSPAFQVLAIHHPRYAEPLLLATPLPLTPEQAWAFYGDRWPIEQVPLTAKTLLGAGRHFVSAPETCQRWPEFVLIAAALANYLAATAPPIPTGFWDRRAPRPTAGRLRRALAACPFPKSYPFPRRLRRKASVTAHLPTGFWHQRSPRPAPLTPPACPLLSEN
jgi:hypothetical protein